MGESTPPTFRRLDNKLIQPAPELMGAWGVEILDEFIAEARKRDYRFCLDLFHIRRDKSHRAFKQSLDHGKKFYHLA